MTLQREIENNLETMPISKEPSEPFFVPTSKQQMYDLENLIGSTVSKFLDFYREKQPNRIPNLKSKTKLLSIDGIIEENTELVPGAFLSKLGIYVFAVTIGGNVVCIDTNDMKNGDPVVLIIDQSFLYIDPDEEEVEIVNLPSYIDEDDMLDQDLEFNYNNIRKYVYKIEDSFVDFIKHFFHNEYEDLEYYL